VKLLLDTHVLLWAATEPERIAPRARSVIEDGENDVFASVVTAWEIAIKQSLGKLDLPEPAESWLPAVLRATGIAVVELGLTAALRVRDLPFHHRDPFDRLLVAQALDGGFTLVSHDAELDAYGAAVIRA
jgi:PIN domain nuclease of toxin-antitoxin system